MRILLVLSAILILFQPAAARAQTGPSVVAKVSAEPRLGVTWGITPRVAVRALGALITDFDDGYYTLDFAVPVEVNRAGDLVTTVAPTATAAIGGSVYWRVGALVGVEHHLSERFGVFGEFGLDVGVDDGGNYVGTRNNTGVGVRVSL